MSLIEKLDGVLALVEKATPGPLIAEDETQDIGRGMLKHYSVVRGADGENIIRLGYTDPNVHAFAAAVNLLRDHGPAIRQAMIDAERYRVLRAGLLSEDWTLIEKLSKACPEPSNEAEFDSAIDAARATGEGEGNG